MTAQKPRSQKGYGRSGSGSPEPVFLIVGRIIRPHGVRGEVAMKIMTDYPDRLPHIETLYLGDERRPCRVIRMRRHRQGMLILFEGIADRNAAEPLRETLVYIHIDDAVPLEEGEYYLFQIKGIRVVADTGEDVGHLTDLIETGANDVYVVTDAAGREILLPVIPEVIQKVDLSAGLMIVHLLDGLL